MKKVILLFVLLPILIASCEQTKEAKAEKVIKKYLKETMDDYGSYSPVSFSEIKIVKSEWKVPKELEMEHEFLLDYIKLLTQAGYEVDITSDADYYIKDLEKYSDKEFLKHINDKFTDKVDVKSLSSGKAKDKALWLEFKHYRDTIYASKKSFQPEFIGWKMTHKFRAKNRMGGTELNKVEFRFDKDITKVIKVRKL